MSFGRNILLVLLLAVCLFANNMPITESLPLGTDATKLDPWTKALLSPMGKLLIEQDCFHIYETEDGDMVDVFILTDGSEYAFERIEHDLNVRANTIVKDFMTTRVFLDMIPDITQHECVVNVQAGKKLKKQNNLARESIGCNDVWAGTSPLPRGYTGSSSLVGVIDSGLDYEHGDFWEGSTCRVKYMWDQEASGGSSPSGFTYGREWTTSALNSRSCTSTDTDGHGTHVAGSAAGNGAMSDGVAAGCAPEADIIIVKTPMTDVALVDATNYCFQKATSMGKPISVNMSIGGQWGPHDGTSPGSDGISDLVAPGRIISIAAGNQNGDMLHAGYNTSSTYHGTEGQPNNTTFWGVDCWYDSGSISFAIGCTDTWSEYVYTDDVAPGGEYWAPLADSYGYTMGYVFIDATQTRNPYNGAAHVVVIFSNLMPPDETPDPYIDISGFNPDLITIGSGRFDAWCQGGSFTDYSSSTWIPGDNDMLVAMPGDAVNAITVASYNTSVGWYDYWGTPHIPGDSPEYEISYFSSHGPTRDGRQKPDIAAPGQYIISTLSGDCEHNYENMPSDYYQKMQGTSMACPMVTGSIALMLDRDPGLTVSEVKSILNASANRDSYTGSVPNYIWGYGKLNIFDAMTRVELIKERRSTQPEDIALAQNYPNPFNGVTNIAFELPEADFAKVAVYDMEGREIAELFNGFAESGYNAVSFNPDNYNIPSGVYHYTIETANNKVSKKMEYIK